MPFNRLHRCLGLLWVGICLVSLAQAAPEEAPAAPEASPIEEAPETAPAESSTAPPAQDDMAAVREELKALREEVAGMREELEQHFERLNEDLKRENDRLRGEAARLRAGGGPDGQAQPIVPMPQSPTSPIAVAESLMAKPEALPELEPEPEPAPAPQEEVPEMPEQWKQAFQAAKSLPPSARPCVFTSVKEWGRLPEAAGKAQAVSLKGMVGTVPPGSKPEQVAALGRKLREQYGEYDNIHIEVFDNPAAAQQYAESRKIDENHHVLTVSKHAESGRDVVLFLKGGNSVEVPFEAPSAEEEPVESPAP